MIYLLLSVAAGCVITIVFKEAALRNRNNDQIVTINYAAAVLISLISAWREGVFSNLRQTGDGVSASIWLALLLGGALGVVYLVNLNVTNASIAKNGAVLTTFFFKASFVGVVLLSALIWADIPNPLQCLGIVLIFIALWLISGSLKNMNAQMPLLLLFVLLAGVFIDLSFKAFSVYALPAYKSLLVLVIFSVAFLLSVVKYLYGAFQKKQSLVPAFPEVVLGICAGAGNTLVSLFQLKALERLPASLVYPSLAAGNLLVIFLIGKFGYREPSGKKEGLAVGLALVSLVLINL